MDTIVKISLGLFILILAAFAGILTYNGYVETSYRNTISGTYTYSCTISTDAPLYNVTLFIPVPADQEGNSPIVSQLSSHMVNGVPADWETTLYDTGKSTLLKITTPVIIPPQGTTVSNPYPVIFSSETTSRTPIDTRNPVGKSAMVRPVQDLRMIPCTGTTGDTVGCSVFTTSVYADYETMPDTRVRIESTLNGKNTWSIFQHYSNEYHAEINLALTGDHHGWAVSYGTLTTGIGSYDVPGVS